MSGIYGRCVRVDQFYITTGALSSYGAAMRQMKAAADDMLKLANSYELVDERASRARYDRQHKKMLRLLKAWNRLEHEREADGSGEQHPNREQVSE